MSSKNEKKQDVKETSLESKAKKKSVYKIAKGKALTSKKGILSDGEIVEFEYLQGGKETLDKFVKSGHIVVE